jgi:predicted TIM-barrel fold metal-dependent hydrolase
MSRQSTRLRYRPPLFTSNINRTLQEPGFLGNLKLSLSVAGPRADLVPGQKGANLARAFNEALAETCIRYQDRTRGFAPLPILAREAATRELARTV